MICLGHPGRRCAGRPRGEQSGDGQQEDDTTHQDGMFRLADEAQRRPPATTGREPTNGMPPACKVPLRAALRSGPGRRAPASIFVGARGTDFIAASRFQPNRPSKGSRKPGSSNEPLRFEFFQCMLNGLPGPIELLAQKGLGEEGAMKIVFRGRQQTEDFKSTVVGLALRGWW